MSNDIPFSASSTPFLPPLSPPPSTSPSLPDLSPLLQCTKATNDILPVVFEKLPQILDPKRLCVQAGLCKERLVEAQ